MSADHSSLRKPTMKKLTIFALATCIFATSTSFADIQSPPGGKHTATRKLGRALGNILYGINELPYNWVRTIEEEGSVYGASIGVVRGTKRTLIRAGYGVFEFATFPFKTYKGSYKPGYGGKSIWWDMNNGYHEVAPELGFQSKFDSSRAQSW